MNPWRHLTVDHPRSRVKPCNLAPVRKVTDIFVRGQQDYRKLLAVTTTLPPSLGHGGPCVLRAV
ncbi:Hypothetical predicted protein, partial [Xyrichtys novacula]